MTQINLRVRVPFTRHKRIVRADDLGLEKRCQRRIFLNKRESNISISLHIYDKEIEMEIEMEMEMEEEDEKGERRNKEKVITIQK